MNYYTMEEATKHISKLYDLWEMDWDTDENSNSFFETYYTSYMSDYLKEQQYPEGRLDLIFSVERNTDGKTTIELECCDDELKSIKEYWRPGVKRLTNKTFKCIKDESKDNIFTMLKGDYVPKYAKDVANYMNMIEPKIIRALNKSLSDDFWDML